MSAVAFIAGLFRGFLGFGFALFAVPLLSFAWPLARTLPVVLAHEILLAALLLPGHVSLVDTRSVRTLLIGSVCCAPLGLALIRLADEQIVRGLIGCVLLACVPLLWREPRHAFSYTGLNAAFFGGLSGVLTGGSALSGPPVIIYFLRRSRPPGVARASLMAYFMINSALVLALGLLFGAYSRGFLADAVLLAPASLAGSALGALMFARYATLAYRKGAMVLIGLLGLMMIAVGFGLEFRMSP